MLQNDGGRHGALNSRCGRGRAEDGEGSRERTRRGAGERQNGTDEGVGFFCRGTRCPPQTDVWVKVRASTRVGVCGDW
jgi:hypothetical protein